MGKVSKRASGYDIPPVGQESLLGVCCAQCKFFKDETCSLVRGRIRGQDSCNLFSQTNGVQLAYLGGAEAQAKLEQKTRLTKQEAGYLCEIPEGTLSALRNVTYATSPDIRPPRGIGYGCHTCKYFNGERQSCFPVQGKIDAFGCCNVHTFAGGSLDLDYDSGPIVAHKLGDSVVDVEELACYFQ